MEQNNEQGKAMLEEAQRIAVDISTCLEQQREQQRKFKKMNLLVTVGIVLVFAVYTLMFMQLYKTNISEGSFKESIQQGVTELAPMVNTVVTEVLSAAVPVYIEAAEQKLDQVMPEVVTILEEESQKFVSNIEFFAEQRLHDSLESIALAVTEEFRKQYPDLTDQQLAQFVADTEEELNNLFIDWANILLDETLPGISELKLAADNMGGNQEFMETGEVAQLLLHKLLMLLDSEVVGPEGLNSGTAEQKAVVKEPAVNKVVESEVPVVEKTASDPVATEEVVSVAADEKDLDSKTGADEDSKEDDEKTDIDTLLKEIKSSVERANTVLNNDAAKEGGNNE